MKRALLVALAACGGKAAPAPSVDNHASATCAAVVDRTEVDGVLYAGWEQVWRALQTVEPEESPGSDADAREWLCAHIGCEGDPPWIVTTGDDDERAFHLAYPVPEGVVVFANLGAGMLGGRCGWEDSVEIDPLPPFHVRVVSVVDDMFYVNTDSEEIRECGDTDETCASACFATSHTTTDHFFDLAARKRLLAITREGRAPADETFHLTEDFVYDTELEIMPETVTIRGGGCDQTTTLRP